MSKQAQIEKSARRKLKQNVKEFAEAYQALSLKYGCALREDIYGSLFIITSVPYEWFTLEEVLAEEQSE